MLLGALSSHVRCPTILLEREVTWRSVMCQTWAWRSQLGCYSPNSWALWLSTASDHTWDFELQFGGLPLVWWREEVCPLHDSCTVGQILQRKGVDGPDSGHWMEGFRLLRVHLSVYSQSHTKPMSAGELFLLAPRESVLWVLRSITHRGGGRLWRQRHRGHIPLRCLVGISKSSSWTAKARSWSILSHHICSETM